MKDFFEWFDDKILVIVAIIIFGVLALMLEVEGSITLIEKLGYGLLGLATGKALPTKKG